MSRRSSHYPDAPDEEAVYGALGLPWCPPELREEPFRGQPPRLVEAEQIRGDLHCSHDLVGRAGERRGDGPRGARARIRVPRDLRPHAGGGRGPRADRRRRPPSRPTRSLPPMNGWRRSGCCAGSSATSFPTGGSIFPTTSSRELDWVQASVHGGQRMPRRELTKRVEGGASQPLRALPQPSQGTDHQPASGERA